MRIRAHSQQYHPHLLTRHLKGKSDNKAHTLKLVLGCTCHAEAVSKRDLMVGQPVDRDAPIDQLACELQVAGVALCVSHEPTLAATPFTHIVVHGIC